MSDYKFKIRTKIIDGETFYTADSIDQSWPTTSDARSAWITRKFDDATFVNGGPGTYNRNVLCGVCESINTLCKWYYCGEYDTYCPNCGEMYHLFDWSGFHDTIKMID